MHVINSLVLKNFRSYKDFSVELSSGVNIVVGPNASGKTNLLEALYVLATGSSFRARNQDLLRFNTKATKIELVQGDDKRSIKYFNNDDKLSSEVNINNQKTKRFDQSKIIPVTLFEPEHLRMIHGAPERRREYLDTILSLTNPGYKNTLRQYKRALTQRNRLLKQPQRIIKDQLFVWDVKIAEFGAVIMHGRLELIAQINQEASKIYKSLSGKANKVELSYKTETKTKDLRSELLRQLNTKVEKDKQRGYTSTGPHRDDVDFWLRGHLAANSASRGETRTLVLMCKLVELSIAEDKFGTKPLLLLDDVFSELDSKRRRALTEHLKDYQVIITTTDADSIMEHFLGDTNVIALQP